MQTWAKWGANEQTQKITQLRSSLCLSNVFFSEIKVETTASTTEIGQKYAVGRQGPATC